MSKFQERNTFQTRDLELWDHIPRAGCCVAEREKDRQFLTATAWRPEEEEQKATYLYGIL